MIDIVCHTCLDLAYEVWPRELPAVPSVGHEIQSLTKHGHFQLSLRVCSVRWQHDSFLKKWIPHIELHMTEFQRGLEPRIRKDAAKGSIIAFYEWYAPLVGRSVSSFI